MTLGGQSQWLLVELNAATTSLLMLAGVGKLYAPAQLGRAFAELFPKLVGRKSLTVAVRVLAAIELATGVGLVTYPTRLGAASAVAVLGVGFVVFGVIGHRRGSAMSCGCFARSDGRPLGGVNIVAGTVLVAVAVAEVSLALPSSFGHRYTASAVAAAALNALLLTVWVHRRIAWAALRSPTGQIESVAGGLS